MLLLCSTLNFHHPLDDPPGPLDSGCLTRTLHFNFFECPSEHGFASCASNQLPPTMEINVGVEAQRVLDAAPDPFSRLGLPSSAGPADIKARYKRLCALHPDKCPANALAAEAFALVSAAYHRALELAAAPPLHSSSQPNQSNRWQAFTGAHALGKQHAGQQQQHPVSGGGAGGSGSEENATPPSDGGGGGGVGGNVQQPAATAAGAGMSSRWGKQGNGGLLRVQPLPATELGSTLLQREQRRPGAAAPGALQELLQQQQQQQQQQPWCGDDDMQHLAADGDSSSSGSGSDDDSSSGSSGDDDARGAGPPTAKPWAAATGGLRPAAFYGSSGTELRHRSSPPPGGVAPTLNHGGFGGRSSGGNVAQAELAGEGGSRWSGRGRLAEVMKAVPVPAVAPAPLAVAPLPLGAGPAPDGCSQPPAGLQPGPGGGGSGGGSGRAHKRRRRTAPVVLSSSSSGGGSEGGSDSEGGCSGDSVARASEGADLT